MVAIKRAIAGLAVCAALVSAPAALADFHTTGYAVGSQQFGLSMGGSPGAGAFAGTWDGDPIIFFCVELTQYFSFGANYVYSASLPNNATFTLLGKLFTEAYGSALSDATHSAAFQLAVWEIVFDGGDLHLNSGGFKVTNDYGHGATVTLAQQWLDGLAGASDGYDVYFLQNDAHQNFITSTHVQVPPTNGRVPEPAPIALLGAALVAALFCTRRKANVRGR